MTDLPKTKEELNRLIDKRALALLKQLRIAFEREYGGGYSLVLRQGDRDYNNSQKGEISSASVPTNLTEKPEW